MLSTAAARPDSVPNTLPWCHPAGPGIGGAVKELWRKKQ